MRAALLSLAASASLTSAQTEPQPPPPSPPGASPEALLRDLVLHSRHVARVQNGRLVGDGADFLRRMGRNVQFVMIGEDHGNQGIAEFAEAYWRDLNESGFRYAAFEIDPWVAEAMEHSLRSGGVDAWTQFLASHGGARAAPFFNWCSEAELAQAVIDVTPSRGTAIWGVDQVFLGAAEWLLRSVASSAGDPQARQIAGTLANEAAGDSVWLGRVAPQRLQGLRSRLTARRDRRNAAIVDGLIRSRQIYGAFIGDGDREAYLSNVDRETLMKRTFLDYYRRAERLDGEPPRVLLKFGAYHMFRGATPTHVQGFGGFVTEFATANGSETLSILMLCGPGSAIRLSSGEVQCSDWFARTWGAIAPHTEREGLTIFDLKAWRMRPRRWEGLPEALRRQIDSFDLIVVVAASPAAVPLLNSDGGG
jgi:hypothetical protein